MTKITLKSLMLLLLLQSKLFSSAQTSKVFIPLFETISMNSNFQYSSVILLKSYLNSEFEAVIQDKAEASPIISNQIELVKARAIEKKADYYVIGSLVKLGETVIVNVDLYKTETNIKVWNDKLRAFTPDDLDPIFQRIGKTLGTDKKATVEDDIYSVTTQEEKPLTKKESNNSFGVGIGALNLFGDLNTGIILSNLNLAWSFDARNYVFDIRPFWCFNKSSDFYGLSIDVNKPIKTKGNTPFVGANVAISRLSTSNDQNVSNLSGLYGTRTINANGSGVSMSIGGGYILGRTSTVSLRASANYIQGFYSVKTDESNYYYSGSVYPIKDYGFLSGVILKLEIFFK